MFHSLLPKPTAEDWQARLHRNPDPQKLLKCLLSKDLDFADKARLFQAFVSTQTALRQESKEQEEETNGLKKKPKTWMSLSDMLWLESKLDAAGEARLAQIMRCYIGFAKDERDEDGNGNEDEDEDMHWPDLVIKGDVKARWIVQREIYVIEEIQALRKTLPLLTDEYGGTKEKADTESRLSALEKELQQLGSDYWNHKQHLWILETCSPIIFGRALQAHWKDPNWYLSDWLCAGCAGRGGCCGRDCGCCEKPRGANRGCSWNQRHYTGVYGCYIRRKGSTKQVKLDGDLGLVPKDVPGKLEDLYEWKLHFAYIWGLDVRDNFMRL